MAQPIIYCPRCGEQEGKNHECEDMEQRSRRRERRRDQDEDCRLSDGLQYFQDIGGES